MHTASTPLRHVLRRIVVPHRVKLVSIDTRLAAECASATKFSLIYYFVSSRVKLAIRGK